MSYTVTQRASFTILLWIQMPRLQSNKNEDVSENGYLKLGSSHGVGPELQRTGRYCRRCTANSRIKSGLNLWIMLTLIQAKVRIQEHDSG